jgi:DNA repair protein RadB
MENKISTGSADLNEWLDGGYEKDVVTMVAGSPGSGKSNLCILAAASMAKKGKKVIFVDTEGGFSLERINTIAGNSTEKILENIMLLSPVDFSEQKEDFEKISKHANSEIGLIVIDSMAMHYRLELGEASSQKNEEKVYNINREVSKQMKTLVEISRKKSIPVLITNQVYNQFVKMDEFKNGFEKETNIVGGDLLQYWSKCIIELKKDGQKRKAVLLKHRNLPEKELNFVIRNEGIFKSGWF